MTIIEILQMLIPFRAGITTAKHVRDQLNDVDLVALIAEQKTKAVVTDIKPPAAGITPNSPDKELYHAINKITGERCFDLQRRREREQGIMNTDNGTTFAAKHSSGWCEYCGDQILEGDLMTLRRRQKVENSDKSNI